MIADAFVSVKCTNYAYNGSGTRPQAVSAASGSGVVVASGGGYYYFVTNHHVISSDNALVSEYKVTDAYDNEYAAELITSDTDADLALLRFRIGTKALSVLEVESEIPDYEEAIAAIGNPLGKHNTLTFGKIKNYKEVEVASDTGGVEVDFEVLWHTAYLASGSSGGALLNAEMKIVGINFATAANSDGDFAYGFAIPGEKVLQFLQGALE